MTYNPELQKQDLINKFMYLSDKYHKLSLLFNELHKSVTLECRFKTLKETKEHIKSLSLDIDKLNKITKIQEYLNTRDIKKEGVN